MKKINYVVRPYIHKSGRVMVRVRLYAWFKTHGGSELPYCIVDDEDGFFISQTPHLVKTDSKTGITNEIADKIIELLNSNYSAPYGMNSHLTKNGSRLTSVSYSLL